MAADAEALFDYLAARPEVRGESFGTTGYCMGGRTSLVVAGRVPQRVAAAMSFHGGGLVTEDADSPHLLAEQIRAAVYVGGAQEDRAFTKTDAETLDKALSDAGKAPHDRVVYRPSRIRGPGQRALRRRGGRTTLGRDAHVLRRSPQLAGSSGPQIS